MTQRTANIIGLSKGISTKYNSASIKRNIAAYMANECAVDIEYYSDELVDSIIIDAFYDFIDDADVPSAFMKDILSNNFNKSYSLTTRILVAFCSLDVKNDNRYVNGFNQNLIDGMNNALELEPPIRCSNRVDNSSKPTLESDRQWQKWI